MTSTDGRTHATQRLIDASCATVYAAFRNARHLARWWGPEGFSNVFEHFDFRSGGAWRFTMHGPDGNAFWNESVFLEVEPEQRVVIEHLSDHHFVLTISFVAQGPGTVVHWRQTFDSEDHYRQISRMVATANEENLDRLAREVLNVELTS
jgi:uncharacterized protein YndB with AHSA1/START domain